MLPREVIRKVKRIELVTRRLVNPELTGQYHSVFKGRGMDFDEVVPYAPGDDVRFIDWNVSARTGGLHTKRFVEERELTVQIVVDTSASMEFGTSVEPKRLVAAQVAAVLAILAIKNNDRVGLTLFDEDVDRYVPPKKGRKHVMRLLTEILEHRPQRTRTDLGAALRYVRRVTPRRAIVFVISDFLTDGFVDDLKLLSRRHDVVPVVVRDPRESSMGEASSADGLWARLWRWLTEGGLFVVDDLEHATRYAFDPGSDRQARAFGEHVGALDHEMHRAFRRLKLDTIEFGTGFETETDYVVPLAAFFRRRSRRH